MPNWGWWTLGLAVLGALTFVGYACLIGVDADRDREWRTRQRLYGANGLRPVSRRRLQIQRTPGAPEGLCRQLRPTTGFRAWLYEHAWGDRP